MPDQRLSNAKRIVVKLGSNVITAENSLNLTVMESISRQISTLMDKGLEVILVSSGAMAAGLRKMGLDRRPDEIPKRQAISAIGQTEVMNTYEAEFGRFGKKVSQILLTGEDLNDRKRYLNARNALYTLMEWKVVPIVNENDTVMVEEIKLGDNDNLAAMITLLMDADFLFILTDIDGLYDKDPRKYSNARLIRRVTAFEEEIEEYASAIPGTLGTGGMLSKILAAKKVTSSGIPMIVARGDSPDILLRLFDRDRLGTYFIPKEEKMSSRKCWIAHTLRPRGNLILDWGAVRAVRKNGKSLLPSGILEVEGEFSQGEAVSLKDPDNKILATGLVNYPADDIRLIKGLRTSQIESCLGNKHYDEVVHRNNLVVLSDC
ncbi:glutamate 5-kinase [Desulfospira joergensenii]|uniref:glutamate 5-kinase n=1 Tax=Desulfospira joergensenii TaxID=53329 RepID=UPI0003B79CC4|nr:glutamate 5-kinase [Desulfospira joergensenii]